MEFISYILHFVYIMNAKIDCGSMVKNTIISSSFKESVSLFLIKIKKGGL